MVITPLDKIDVEIIPEILQMPMYCLEENGYIPLAFFTELGASVEDIETIIRNDSINNESICKIRIDRLQTISAISYKLACLLITHLALMPQYPIFTFIDKKLVMKSFESGAISVDDFAEEFRSDSVFWQSKISNLPTKSDTSKPIYIRPHPQVDFAAISRLEGQELDAYLDLNPAFVSYKVTQFLCNHHLPITEDFWNNDVWNNNLFKCLHFHRRDLEYHYFIYHLLVQDENI